MFRPACLVVGGAALLALTGCASAAASIDLDDAREWVESVQAAESDGPGAAGTATMLAGPGSEDDDAPEDQDDSGVTLTFDAAVSLKRADARCFGGGVVDVGVTAWGPDGTTSETFGAQVPCDEQAHGIVLDSFEAGSVLLTGTTPETTYLYIAVIQEMSVEE